MIYTFSSIQIPNEFYVKYNKKVINSYGKLELFNFCNIDNFFIIMKNNNFYKRLDINERKKKRKFINKINIYAINLIQKI